MKKLLLLLTFLFCNFCNGQALNIDAPAAEYLYLNSESEISFISLIDSSRYQETIIKIRKENNDTYQVETRRARIHRNFFSNLNETYIHIPKLRKDNTRQILLELEKTEFYNPENERVLKLYKGYIILNNQFHKLVPVTINNSYIILLVYNCDVRNYYGNNTPTAIIFPYKDKFYLEKFSEKSRYHSRTGNNLKSDIDLSLYFPKGMRFIKKGKIGLKTSNAAGRTILPPIFDSIHIENSSFLRAYKNQKISFFLNDGSPVPTPDIRAEYADNNSKQSVLIGNKVSWLNSDGTISDEYNYRGRGMGCDYGITDSISIRNGYYIFDNVSGNYETNTGKYQITKASNFKSLVFLNQKTTIYGSCDWNPDYKQPKHVFIATSNDGSKNIVRINYTENKTKIIKLFSLNNLEILSDDIGEPLRFEKNGLKGLWPMNKTAIYKRLGNIGKGFVRFTKANGKKGWLCLDGNEYRDL